MEALMRDLRHESAVAFPELQAWITRLQAEGKSTKTVYDYTREIAKLLRENPDTPFADFTPEQIDATLVLKPEQSRKITRSVFNGWFSWGVLMDRLDRNPMNKVAKAPRTYSRPRDIYDEGEIILLEALPSPDGQLCTLLFCTGIRKAGARNLQRKDLDLERGWGIVTEKGRKTREIWLPPEAVRAVADLDLLEGLNPKDYLWYSRPGGRSVSRREPISGTTFDRWWGGDESRGMLGVCQRAGVRRLPVHQTRHTYNNRLQNAAIGIEFQQQLMGHENIATTKRYNRVGVKEAAVVAAERWGAWRS
jgi:integrase